jgi:WD40 repeat protein
MILEYKRLVKCCLTDGSTVKDYTSILFDAERPTGIPAEIWEIIGPNSPQKNYVLDIAATTDQKLLFAACGRWWAIFDLQQDKCVSRKFCMSSQGPEPPTPMSVAVGPDDQLFYMVTSCGTVESYDIQAAKTSEVKSIPNQCLVKITVDPGNQFVFIASQSGNLYKYDTQ